mmetsp:Transcript_74582/g.131928  ORF Transcript_74582/g.131928 Transcript_74582/m.131928 type:complete len:210 (+) Transcript_74582:1374-2003(+)
MHLHPLQVDGFCTDCFAHFDSITCAVLTIGSRKMQQIRAVLCQQGICAKVCAKAASCQDHGSELLEFLPSLLVSATNALSIVDHEVSHACLGNQSSQICPLYHSLQRLYESISDCHAWEALLPPVCAWLRMTAQTCQQRKIQRKFVHEPIYICTTVGTKNFGDRWPLCSTFQGILDENILGVRNPFLLLSPGLSTVDATRGLGGVAAAE